jgi:type II secretory pathway pseudopilin PulG
MKKNSAFTVLELSIVLILIGILIAGVAKSGTLVMAARLSAARSLTLKSTVPSISGLVAWYETSLSTSLKTSEALDGKQITTWYDISPNSLAEQKNKLTRTASSTVLYQVSGINKIPSIKFSGAANAMLAGLTDFYQYRSLAKCSIFFVAMPLTSSLGIIADGGSGAYGVSLVAINPPNIYFNLTTGVSTGTGSNPASIASNGSYITAAYFNGATSGAYVNNAATMAGGGTINPGTNTLRGLTIGAGRDGSSGFNGLISEVIVYDRLLQIQERKDVMKYLSKKYGIATTGLE